MRDGRQPVRCARLVSCSSGNISIAQINRFGGNISRTASFVGMERSALHRKLRSLGISSAAER